MLTISFLFILSGLENTCLSAHCVQTASYLLNAMDQSAEPCEDFFQYACGSWNRKHIIPEVIFTDLLLTRKLTTAMP